MKDIGIGRLSFCYPVRRCRQLVPSLCAFDRKAQPSAVQSECCCYCLPDAGLQRVELRAQHIELVLRQLGFGHEAAREQMQEADDKAEKSQC